jgi:hypothetical protein
MCRKAACFARRVSERSRSTDEDIQSNPLDIRLQDLIVGWKGSQRGEPLAMLHSQCADIAGRDNPLLPRSVYLVHDLVTLLQFCRVSEEEKREYLKWPPKGDWLALGESPMLVLPCQGKWNGLTRQNQHGQRLVSRQSGRKTAPFSAAASHRCSKANGLK